MKKRASLWASILLGIAYVAVHLPATHAIPPGPPEVEPDGPDPFVVTVWTTQVRKTTTTRTDVKTKNRQTTTTVEHVETIPTAITTFIQQTGWTTVTDTQYKTKTIEALTDMTAFATSIHMVTLPTHYFTVVNYRNKTAYTTTFTTEFVEGPTITKTLPTRVEVFTSTVWVTPPSEQHHVPSKGGHQRQDQNAKNRSSPQSPPKNIKVDRTQGTAKNVAPLQKSTTAGSDKVGGSEREEQMRGRQQDVDEMGKTDETIDNEQQVDQDESNEEEEFEEAMEGMGEELSEEEQQEPEEQQGPDEDAGGDGEEEWEF